MSTTIRYILLTAMRDWLFYGLFATIALATGISSFLGETALVENQQMSISYASSSARVILLIGLIVFVCFHVRTAFENREIELIISRPISRTEFVFSYWLGFACVSLFLIIPIFCILYLMKTDISGLFYWSLSLLMESFFVVAFALCSSLILRSAVTSVLLCFTFYFISRMMGFFLYILESPYTFSNLNLNYVTGKIILYISMILPRLDLYGKSQWLIYGITDDINYYFFIPQTIIYVPLILWMAIYDFKRKQF